MPGCRRWRAPATCARCGRGLRIVHRLEPLFPIAALVTARAWARGSFTCPKASSRWSDGWLLTGLITLVVIEALAGALLAPKAKAAVKAVEHAA